ncbi:MAG: hypothetical protein RR945_03210 [Erysipelotrichaceae bacterium]
MKRTLVIACAILIAVCSMGGYYVWCSYHPEVTIKISAGPTGKEGIKMEAPHISIAPTGIAEPSASIELKTTWIIQQHEFFCTYIKDTYETADIKLDMEVRGNEPTLKYSGTATTEDGKIDNIQKEFNSEFALDANIIN